MAEITLNKNSWHFKYYSSVVSDKTPRSLCPYFWTMVALTILSPFIGIVCGMGFIMKHVTNFFDNNLPKKEKKQETPEEWLENFKKEQAKSLKRDLVWNKIGDGVSFVFRYFIFPLVLIGVFYTLYLKISENGWGEMLIALAICVIISLIIIGIFFLIEKFGGKIGGFIIKVLKALYPLNWKITIIIGEMIKTAYTKACPLITWEETTK